MKLVHQLMLFERSEEEGSAPRYTPRYCRVTYVVDASSGEVQQSTIEPLTPSDHADAFERIVDETDGFYPYGDEDEEP